MSDAARNEPCPCGSGKKYKRCCWQTGGVGLRYTAHDRQVALRALEELVDGPGWREIEEEALDEFWEDVEPAEGALDDDLVASMSNQMFEWWLFFDYQYDGHHRVVDALLEAAPDLSRGARAYLELAKTAQMWLYEVTKVQPGHGMTLRDVVTGTEQRVSERSGSRETHRGDVFATRIMPAEKAGDPVLDGGMLPIPQSRAGQLIEWLKEVASQASARRLGFDQLAPEFHAAWITPLEMPALVNFDGDAVLLARAYFDVEDRGQVTALLDGAPELERCEEPGDSPRWSWSGTGSDRDECVLFGWFAFADGRLVFETNSSERAQRGRELVERVAGSAAEYRVTRTEDVAQAVAAAKQGHRSASGAKPVSPELPEAERTAVEQYMSEYYERWLDESIPRLDGKTPREAARANDARIVEMLRELEVMCEKALSSGQPAFDPTWMWQELGLTDERDAPVTR